MAIKRRAFIGGLLTSPLWLQSLPYTQAAALPATLVSAAQLPDGTHALVLLGADGQVLLQHPLPDRAHQVLLHPTRPWVIAVARRPGTFIEIVDITTQQRVRQIRTEPGFHLYGHAQISPDGRYLWTTERQPTADEGVVVMRDLENGAQVVKQLGTAGVGPHELKLIDETHLVVANGGILTEGREKLNLASMQPSLVRLHPFSGQLLEQRQLPAEYHQSSIRHIDTALDGTVLVAMQYQGGLLDAAPLVAVQRPGQSMRPLWIPEAERLSLKQYCGSACVDSRGAYAAVSAPRGDKVLFWSLADEQYLGAVKARDACGLAAGLQAGEFYVSTGAGKLYRVSAPQLGKQRLPTPHDPMAWDNHMMLG